MSMREQMQFESGFLHVVLTGEFFLEETKRNFQEVLGGIVRYRATKVLLDGRMVKGKPGDMERFYLGEFAAKETMRLVMEHGIFPKFACVIHEPVRDPRKFGETVMVNRGMNIKVCETLEEAFAWLELTLPTKAGASDAA